MLKNVKEKMNMIEKQMEYPNIEINIQISKWKF